MRNPDYLVPETSIILLEAEAYVCASASVTPFEEGEDLDLEN